MKTAIINATSFILNLKQKQQSFISLIIIILLISFTFVLSDPCCRRNIECFSCDSRDDPRCSDPFNLTRETGKVVRCDDLCVKLKYESEGTYHYIRNCATTLKKIYIKKTEVCYTTRKNTNGYLCFCDQGDICNDANTIKIKNKTFYFILISIIVFPFCYMFVK
jgi:hypothetical protein